MFMEKIIGVFSTVTFAWAGVLYITFNLSKENSATLFYILTGLYNRRHHRYMSITTPRCTGKILKLLDRFKIGKYFEN